MSVKQIADVHDAQLVCIEYLPEKSIRIDFLKVDNTKKSLLMTGVKFFFCNQLLEGNTVLSVDVLATEEHLTKDLAYFVEREGRSQWVRRLKKTIADENLCMLLLDSSYGAELARVRGSHMRSYIEAALTALAILSVAACATTPPKGTNLLEAAVPVSVCQVLADPARYNHKLIKVAGVLDHGFEGFVLSDAACSRGGDAIWLEYGGKRGSGTVLREGLRPIEIARAALRLTEYQLQSLTIQSSSGLDRLIQNRKSVSASATIVGRYFAGELDGNYSVPDPGAPSLGRIRSSWIFHVARDSASCISSSKLE